MESAESILQEEAELGFQPPWWRVIVTPWVDILRPRAAAAHMVAASPWAFWITFGLHAVLLTAVVLWLTLWAGTVEVRWTVVETPPSGTSTPAAPNYAPKVYERTYAEALRNRQQYGWIDPVVSYSLFIPTLLIVCTACGAWLHLPNAFSSGPVLKTYRRLVRVVGSCLGLLLLLVLGVGSLFVAVANFQVVSSVSDTASSNVLRLVEIVPVLLVFMGTSLLLMWIGQAVHGTRDAPANVAHQPRCEGCGYDLTHVPANGLCPECGVDASSSLTPSVRRPGCTWETQEGIRSWLGTSWVALRRPGVFYAALKLRTPETRSLVFIRSHYLAIGCGTAFWFMILACSLTIRYRGPEETILDAIRAEIEVIILMSITFAFLAPLLGWVVHRTVAAVAASWWLARGLLVDFTWARKVLVYETVFLWVFCLYNGVLISSFVAFDTWISSSAASPVINNVFQMPAEFAAVVFGNLALGLLWLWRYRIAVRAIRWSNF